MTPEPFAVVYHQDSTKYDFGGGHPFRSDRFTSFWALLEDRGLLEDPRVNVVKPDAATEQDLFLVHPQEYVEDVSERRLTHPWLGIPP